MERVTKDSGVNESLNEKHAPSIRNVSHLAAADTFAGRDGRGLINAWL